MPSLKLKLKPKRYVHIRDNPAAPIIAKLLAEGLNQTSIAYHLNHAAPAIAPPYGYKEWTPLMVTTVYNCAILDRGKGKGGKA